MTRTSAYKQYVETYGEYLEDLRRRLYRTALLFAAAFACGFFATTPLVRLLVRALSLPDATLVATSPFQLVDLAMNVGLCVAIVATLPFLVWQAYAFLRPGLIERERRLFLLLIPLALGLFCAGFAYGAAILYYALGLIARVNTALGVANLWDITQFLSQITLTAALLGVLFELPLALTILMRAGILDPRLLREKRPHAIVAILILVALLPPTDGLSFIVMSVPLMLIYELTIRLNSRSGMSVL
jgi:sec-independent protein translocase protein TatC